VTYAAEDLMDEVAYVSAAYHWPIDAALDLEHGDRAHFIAAYGRFTEEASE
jgi:hypothetical protein